jgi:two-component system OmpR family sensor kinase
MSASLIGGSRNRPRLWLRSLTSKLVAGVVSLVVVLVLAIGASTYWALKSFLYDRLDQQLATTANRSSIPVVLTPHKFGAGLEVPQTIWVAVVSDATGRLTSFQPEGPDLTPLELPAATLRSLAGRDSGPTTYRTKDQEWVRAMSVTGLTAAIDGTSITEPVTVVIGLSEHDVRRTLGRTVAIEIVIGMSAVCVAFLATSWGVQRSLRNLYRVTGTAREVAAELSPEGAGLDRRVPVVEEGTEVGQLAESMNTLLAAVETQFKARLESENRMRQFLADASHELRTPLTSIRGYAELARMQRAAYGETEAGHAENLDRIESEGTRMSRLVDDLLLLARGDASGATHIEERVPVDMEDVLDDAVSGSRAAFPDRPVDTQISPLPAVPGDRDQLLRAIRNLVTNAAVHTAEGRPILVRAFPDAGGVVVIVADGGPGLPPEQAAHVFERFWRADKARTRARGGSGLGLSIVAAIVRAHGGSVQFDSSVERGSTVTLWLPAVAE